MGGDRTLQRVMDEAASAMQRLGKKLFDEKTRFNQTAYIPMNDAIGYGTTIIPYHHDNLPKLVANFG